MIRILALKKKKLLMRSPLLPYWRSPVKGELTFEVGAPGKVPFSPDHASTPEDIPKKGVCLRICGPNSSLLPLTMPFAR